MIFDELDKLSAREKIGVGLAVAFVIALGVERFIVEPMVSDYREIAAGIENQRRDLDFSLSVIKLKEQAEAGYRKVEDLLEKPETESQAIAAMKSQIDVLADRMGVVLKSRDHLKPQKKKFFDEYYIDIKGFEADGRDFLTFVHSLCYLRNAPGMLQISSLKVVPQKDSGLIDGAILVTKVMTPLADFHGEDTSQ